MILIPWGHGLVGGGIYKCRIHIKIDLEPGAAKSALRSDVLDKHVRLANNAWVSIFLIRRIMPMYVQLYPGLFTTPDVLNDKHQVYEMDKKAPIMLNAAWHLSNKLNITNPPNIYYYPVQPDDGLYLWGHYNNKNEIFINFAMNLYYNIRALAHEFVHAQQAQLGYLKIIEKDKSTTIYQWKGCCYEFKCKDAQRSDNIKYLSTPWEKDAMNKEDKLIGWLLTVL